MKKNSINSLKKWVSKIRRYEYEIPRLYEKLEYLEVKSIGYNSPSFAPRISSKASSNSFGIDYWLEKIDECERELKYKEKEVEKYYNFLEKLEELEREIFVDYLYHRIPPRDINKKYKIHRSKIYDLFNLLNRSDFIKKDNNNSSSR